jgi:hypothetical protein
MMGSGVRIPLAAPCKSLTKMIYLPTYRLECGSQFDWGTRRGRILLGVHQQLLRLDALERVALGLLGRGGGRPQLMIQSHDLPEFLGRVGCLYGKSNLCPPFLLEEFAEAWFLEGISFRHCLDQIGSYLAQHSGRHRCGSGDGSLSFVDHAIRKSWSDKHRPQRAKPERTDRYFQRLEEVVTDHEPCGPIPSPNFSAPVARKPPPPPRQKPIEAAKALLKRELANGQVLAVDIEEAAKAEGISLRTLDRARKELVIFSHRTGFAKTGRSWLSLPSVPADPRAPQKSTFSNQVRRNPALPR